MNQMERLGIQEHYECPLHTYEAITFVYPLNHDVERYAIPPLANHLHINFRRDYGSLHLAYKLL